MHKDWFSVLKRYLAAILVLNLVWEAAQMPLYTLWSTGSGRQIVLYGLHCTVGDWLIALSSLIISLFAFGAADWPNRRYRAVAVAAVVLGATYTIGSEWYNTQIAGSWKYADTMPIAFGIGLLPVLQWLIVPMTAFWWARR